MFDPQSWFGKNYRDRAGSKSGNAWVMKSRLRPLLLAVFLLPVSGCEKPLMDATTLERAKEFTLSSLSAVPQDISNQFADNPAAIELGRQLFSDTGLSANNAVSCASCHQADKQFQDGLPLGVGIGQTPRRTMHLAGSQWGEWFFWDGRKDSQWSQALEPLETPSEHGMTRDMVGREILGRYRQSYESLFGKAPSMENWPYFASPLVPGQAMENWSNSAPLAQQEINEVFANTGKALAAFQRTILPKPNRFDRFVDALLTGDEPAESYLLSKVEIEGFKLFIGKANCDNCHSGPLFTDHFFHNTGIPIKDLTKVDFGRATAVTFLKSDVFSCLGPHSDAPKRSCRELEFMSEDPTQFEGAFKTPGLRGVSTRAPYMHNGQMNSLEEVVAHYIKAPDPYSAIPDIEGNIEPHGSHADTKPLDLSDEEIKQLIAFLKVL